MNCRSIAIAGVLLFAGQAAWLPAQNTEATQKERLGGMALGMLDQVKQARESLSARDQQAALHHVSAAIEMANRIQKESPPEKRPLIVPVYTELEKVSYLTNVKKGEEEVSGKVSANRLKKNSSVSQVTGQYTRVLVNVTDASQRLQDARASLLQNHPDQADQALQAAQKQVVERSGSGNLPLLRVKENLDLARARVLENKPKQAAAPLGAAVRGLQEYAKVISPGPRTQEAQDLAGQIDSYTGSIRRDHSEALTLIDSWRDTVNRWIEQMTE